MTKNKALINWEDKTLEIEPFKDPRVELPAVGDIVLVRLKKTAIFTITEVVARARRSGAEIEILFDPIVKPARMIKLKEIDAWCTYMLNETSYPECMIRVIR
jgi:hypothetical protein